jgi:hypothetical protein
VTTQEHPCALCGEPTLNVRICRDCFIDELWRANTCLACGLFVANDFGKKFLGGANVCACDRPRFPEET